jgi:hypothetical protein
MKNYKKIQIKNYLKNHSWLFITNSINQNSQNQILVKQKLTKLKINFYKTYNRLTKKLFQKSLYKNCIELIYNLLYFLIPKQKNFNFSLIKSIEKLKFLIVGIKFNKKFMP